MDFCGFLWIHWDLLLLEESLMDCWGSCEDPLKIICYFRGTLRDSFRILWDALGESLQFLKTFMDLLVLFGIFKEFLMITEDSRQGFNQFLAIFKRFLAIQADLFGRKSVTLFRLFYAQTFPAVLKSPSTLFRIL